MALHQKPETTEAVARLRALLQSTLAGASQGAEATTRAVGLAAYFVRLRSRLKATLSLFQQEATVEDDERVLREAQLLFLRRRESFHTAANRSDLVRAWNDLLVEAAEKVSRDKRDVAAYAHDAGEMDDDDRDWYSATRRIAESR
jgi:hypothetical protein